MVFLSPSATESAFIFSTDDGSDAYVLDIKGIYALVDGGAEPLGFTHSLRTPSAAIVSSASPAGFANATEMNKQTDSLVAVVGNLPSAAALKDAAAAEPLRELYKTLAMPPVVAQLKGAKPEPLVIHKGLSSGTLSVYTLAGDAKDAEAVAKAYQSGSSESIEAAAAAASSVLLIVWQPVREDAPIKRILHLGSAPLPRIQQALERARALPFLQSATPTAASLKAKPAAGARPAAAAPAARPAARAAPAPAAAKPAARAAPAARPAPAARTAAPATARPAPTTTAAAAAPKPSSARASMPARPAAAGHAASGPAASSAARPARASSATSSSRPAAAAPAARAAARSTGSAGKEEVAKKTIVSKSAAAPSSARSTPSGAASRTPTKGAAAPSSARASPAAAAGVAAAAGAAAVAATTVVATAASSDPTPSVQHEEEAEPAAPAAAAAPAAHPSISVSIDDVNDEDGLHQTPGGLPVPASPTIIPATPQPPMSPEPTDEEEHVVTSPEPSEVSAVDVDDKWLQQPEEPAAPVAPAAAVEPEAEPVVPSAPLEPEPTVPSAPVLEPAASVDEPECVKELVEEDPKPEPDHKPVPPQSDDAHEDQGPKEEEAEDPFKPIPEPAAPAADEEPEPVQPSAPAPTPVEPATGGDVGDLLGDFGDQPVQPQQPGDDGLLDSLEEPMKKMQISMDTDKLAEELGLVGGEEKKEGGAEGETSLLDLTQESTMDTDLEKTQNSSVIESAHEYDDGHLSPVGGGAAGDDLLMEMQRKLSQQAEESLLTAAADPFIAGLASTVVEAATIDGAKSTLESLISNNRGVESPTGDKLLSFRSSGYENPDEPKEVKYEETDPAIDDVLTKLADESDMVNGAPRHVELNGHGDSTPTNNGHLTHSHHGGVEVHGNGWPEGTTMHLPPPTTTKGGAGKFKLAGPVHVDMVTVPHRGKQILLTDEATSLEFFSAVRSSIYLLQTGGEVPVHVLDGWKKGKGAWAANVPSRLIPTHHNEVVSRWTADNHDELAEIGLTVATPVDLTTLTYPDGQAKACTVAL